MDSPIQVFSRRLCPWLQDEFTSLETARRAGRLGHAWLFTGPWGVGKINLALALAERLLEPTASLPETLDAAAAAAARASLYEPADHRPDLHCIFPEEQRRSIGIDQIREACQQLALSSLRGVAKVMLVEPAEGMTTAAANALLKTLEEPTASTYVLLVSHQPGRLPATIRSRCQVLAVRRPAIDRVLGWVEAAGIRAVGPGLPPNAAPFECLDWALGSNTIDINKLCDDIDKISEKSVDPSTVADDWLRSDHGPWLDALAVLLRSALRAQLAAGDSTRVTDSGTVRLHNVQARFAPRQLFAQLERIENLLASRGSGINEELALRVILLGFQSTMRQPRSM